MITESLFLKQQIKKKFSWCQKIEFHRPKKGDEFQQEKDLINDKKR